MAVELLITNKRTGAGELVAIATSRVFRDYWRVGSAGLGLRLIPLLEDGLFEKKDIPNLLTELAQLRDWFQKSQSPNEARELAQRVDNAVQALERVAKDAELTIG